MAEPKSPNGVPPGDRRGWGRHPCHARAVCRSTPIVTGTSCLASIRDVSASGVGLVCAHEFEPGATLLVDLSGTGSKTLPPLMVRVVRTRREGNGLWSVGCAFRVRLDDEQLRAVLNGAGDPRGAPSAAELAPPYRRPAHDPLEGLAQALFAEAGDALLLFDPDSGQMLDANPTAQRLTGFPLHELLRLQVTELFRAEGAGRLQSLCQAARKTTVFHSQPGYLLRTLQEGVWIPVNLTIARLHVRPKPLGLITARDAREQSKALAQAKKSEEDLRRILASVPDCVWAAEIDEAGQFAFRYLSPVVEQVTGRPPEHFLAGVQRWWAAIHPEDQPRWAQALQRLRAGQPSQEEYRLIRPNGSVRWVRDSVLVTPGTDGRSLWLAGVLGDITERRQAEATLREAEDHRRQAADAATEGIWLVDAESRTAFVNGRVARLLGYGAGEMVGRSVLDFIDKEARPAAAAGLDRARQQQAERHDFTFRRRDGGRVAASVSARPFFDAEGRHTGTLLIVADGAAGPRREPATERPRTGPAGRPTQP
jgi:PAS domain S-box-containing protein